MQPQQILSMASAALGANKPEVDAAAVDKAFETLKTYDWGDDRNQLNPIDDAIVATEGDVAARKQLEGRLIEVLKSGAARSAKDFVCRKLRTVGTAQSVPALAGLLADEGISHMARYALERIDAAEAAAAMRDAVGKLEGNLKAGAIGSLGARRDAGSVSAIAGCLGDGDAAVVRAAAAALGNIGDPAASKALQGALDKAPDAAKTAVAAGALDCGYQLLADGKKGDALAMFKALNGPEQPKNVRLAATKGLLAVAGK